MSEQIPTILWDRKVARCVEQLQALSPINPY